MFVICDNVQTYYDAAILIISIVKSLKPAKAKFAIKTQTTSLIEMQMQIFGCPSFVSCNYITERFRNWSVIITIMCMMLLVETLARKKEVSEKAAKTLPSAKLCSSLLKIIHD